MDYDKILNVMTNDNTDYDGYMLQRGGIDDLASLSGAVCAVGGLTALGDAVNCCCCFLICCCCSW